MDTSPLAGHTTGRPQSPYRPLRRTGGAIKHLIFSVIRCFFQQVGTWGGRRYNQGLTGTSQYATIYGRNNVIIQIQGDGNTVVPGLPHLTLTRYITRRHQAPTEVRLLSPYAMTIPLVGRQPELADLNTWLTHEKPISIRV